MGSPSCGNIVEASLLWTLAERVKECPVLKESLRKAKVVSLKKNERLASV